MDIAVELHQIMINETADQQIVVLKEVAGDRSFPIVIGMPEILAIDRRIKGLHLPRPLTHDLLADVIEKLGAKVEKIVVNDLKEHTFFARIHIRQGNKIVEIDSRPSDALGLAAGLNVPLFAADSVFEQLKM